MILIAYDGSADAQAAIERAGELFGGESAVVLAVWVPFVDAMAHVATGLVFAPAMVDTAAVDAAVEAAARERADEGAERARSAGLDAQARTRAEEATGVAQAIIAEAAEVDAAAIVVGTRGLRGLKSLMLGSISHAVLNHADRPVLVVPSAHPAAATP
jgi:nucleotide-binding universal stress UspA family protein